MKNIYVKEMDELTKEQWENCCNHPAFVKGALMPDAHGGYDAPIGAVIALKDWVVPSWVGYDIGCGMCAVPLGIKLDRIQKKLKEIHNKIHEYVPCGFGLHKEPIHKIDIKKSDATRQALNRRKVQQQLGTLGTGNHFLELDIDENNQVWIVIHSGSRGFGHEVATYWMKKQKEHGNLGFSTKSELGKQYIEDMEECLAYALLNRELMIEQAIKAINSVTGLNIQFNRDVMINRNHNHMDIAHGLCIHRKGATHSEKDMLGVIPGNMRDGSYIVKGLGNEDGLWSSSHGAGRKMSRRQAKKKLDINRFREQMQDIVGDVSKSTLDEAPDAYKNIDEIVQIQVDAGIIDVIHYLKSVLNVKG